MTQGNWQDISSCPKDGTWFIGRDIDVTYPCAWDEDLKLFVSVVDFCIIDGVLPSLWKPVPKAIDDGKWQPIETAPKDGTNILCFVPTPNRNFTGIIDCHWLDCPEDEFGPACDCWYNSYVGSVNPSHWRLPEPPESA